MLNIPPRHPSSIPPLLLLALLPLYQTKDWLIMRQVKLSSWKGVHASFGPSPVLWSLFLLSRPSKNYLENGLSFHLWDFSCISSFFIIFFCRRHITELRCTENMKKNECRWLQWILIKTFLLWCVWWCDFSVKCCQHLFSTVFGMLSEA